MRRDFTYIDDVVEGVVRLLDQVPVPQANWDPGHPDPATSRAPYRLYNIGNNQPVEVLELVEQLERALGQTTEKKLLPMQPEDVPATWADVDDLSQAIGFRPATPLEEGVRRFVEWYRAYYRE
jgi:UDP-glucuronate 4-epimerase